jgi:hypothetical protein
MFFGSPGEASARGAAVGFYFVINSALFSQSSEKKTREMQMSDKNRCMRARGKLFNVLPLLVPGSDTLTSSCKF